MERKIDLADPDFEPSDDELQELSRRAFAGVGKKYSVALKRLEEDIERSRREVLAHVEAELAKAS